MTSSIIRRPFHYSYHSAVLWLIAANVLVFAAGLLVPDITYYLALNPASLLQGAIWQPVTYMFAHAGLSHLLFNMLGLFFFGTAVERSVGTREFLLYYFLIGVLAGLFSFVTYVLTGAMGTFLLGASGAIFGLLLAYATLFPESRIFVWGIIPVKAPILVLVYAGIELFS
ncbi:MAG: rhomboid family intramembrane serine protease, partial [Treponema sp.]|nr:rhomboid family intramembrane serine protease [Treponema sp.]